MEEGHLEGLVVPEGSRARAWGGDTIPVGLYSQSI